MIAHSLFLAVSPRAGSSFSLDVNVNVFVEILKCPHPEVDSLLEAGFTLLPGRVETSDLGEDGEKAETEADEDQEHWREGRMLQQVRLVERVKVHQT